MQKAQLYDWNGVFTLVCEARTKLRVTIRKALSPATMGSDPARITYDAHELTYPLFCWTMRFAVQAKPTASGFLLGRLDRATCNLVNGYKLSVRLLRFLCLTWKVLGTELDHLRVLALRRNHLKSGSLWSCNGNVRPCHAPGFSYRKIPKHLTDATSFSVFATTCE